MIGCGRCDNVTWVCGLLLVLVYPCHHGCPWDFGIEYFSAVSISGSLTTAEGGGVAGLDMEQVWRGGELRARVGNFVGVLFPIRNDDGGGGSD